MVRGALGTLKDVEEFWVSLPAGPPKRRYHYQYAIFSATGYIQNAQCYVKGTTCWSGVYFSRPEVLVLEAYNIPRAAAENAAVGRILSKDDPDFGHFEKQSKDPFKWVNRLDLESEEVHFFALSPENQQKRVEEFVRTSASAVKEMTPE